MSGNAYFLVYRQRISPFGASDTAAPAAAAPADAPAGPGSGGGHAAAPANAGGGDPGAAALSGPLAAELAQLPQTVRERVQQLHAAYAAACAKFQAGKQQLLATVARRQDEVRSVAALLPVRDAADAGVLVPAAWLEGWANSEATPEPIDNSVLLCEHQQLSPCKPPTLFKHISSLAWEQLVVRLPWRCVGVHARACSQQLVQQLGMLKRLQREHAALTPPSLLLLLAPACTCAGRQQGRPAPSVLAGVPAVPAERAAGACEQRRRRGAARAAAADGGARRGGPGVAGGGRRLLRVEELADWLEDAPQRRQRRQPSAAHGRSVRTRARGWLWAYIKRVHAQ